MKSFNKQVSMLCPVCGNDQFEPIEIINDDYDDVLGDSRFRCSDCGSVFTKDQLLEENEEKISIAISEMKDDILKNFENELKKVAKRWRV